MLLRHCGCAVIALAVIACRAAEEAPATDSTVVTGASSAVRAPAGSSSSVPADTPITRVPADMQSVVDTASLTTIQAIVGLHPQRVDSTLSEMTETMKRENRTPSAEWTALHDSVRKDLDKLATVDTSALVAFFREHYARLTRLKRLYSPTI